jgi:hypothetical protein
MTIDNTVAKIGRSMKNREITVGHQGVKGVGRIAHDPQNNRQKHRAAGPPTNTSYRSTGLNPLPLVAKHRETFHDPPG